MERSKDLFIRMQESEYLAIPPHIRATHLSSKIYRESLNDFDELMQDETYARLYKEKKRVTEELEERQYQLRENKRKNNLNQ